MGELGWPVLPNMDYRYGLPMTPADAEALAQLPEELRAKLLARFETGLFEAFTRLDIEGVPETPPR